MKMLRNLFPWNFRVENNLGIRYEAYINISTTKLPKISKLFLKKIHVSRSTVLRKWKRKEYIRELITSKNVMNEIYKDSRMNEETKRQNVPINRPIPLRQRPRGEERGSSINGKRFIADKSCPGSMEKICNFIEREIYYSRAKFSSSINPDRLIRGLLSPLI